MKYVVCYVRNGNIKKHDGEKSLKTLIKHVLPAKVRAINRYNANHHSTRKRHEWGGGGSMKKVVCQQDQQHDRDPLHDEPFIRHQW